MVEEPKQHDFDQRHDGPFEVPALVHDSTHDKTRHASAPQAVKDKKSHSVQYNADRSKHSPLDLTIPERRHSATDVADGVAFNGDSTPTGVGRKSTQMSRAPRPSEDFDRRYDGPYSRPSITMTRRRSSNQIASPTAGGRGSEPELPIMERHSQVEDDGPPPRSVDTMVSDPAFEPEPPALPYDLRSKKRKLWFFWIFVIIDSVLMPIGLYFGLWYTVHKDGRMSANTVFSIVTAAIGGIAIFEYFLRSWALWKKDSTCRPTGAGRWYFDWFLWHYTIGWVIVMLELVM
jgi:hypothetical protein